MRIKRVCLVLFIYLSIVPVSSSAQNIENADALLPIILYVLNDDSATGTGNSPSNALPLNRSSWNVSASRRSSDVANAIDGDPSTRWSTNETQRPNQTFTIGFQQQEVVSRIVMDTRFGNSGAGDYPRSFTIQLSEDGQTYSAPAFTGEGSESGTTDVSFTAQTARYIRITQTGNANRDWWSIYELNVYGVGTVTEEPPITEEPPVSEEPPVVVGPNLNRLQTAKQAARFLIRAGFGPNDEDIAQWTGRDAADWLKEEFDKGPRPLLPITLDDSALNARITPTYPRWTHDHLKTQLFDTESVLRTKMTYALSQILVVGGDIIDDGEETRRGIAYRDLLHEGAFGNYRDLLQEVTYSVAMGTWLTSKGSEKGNPETGQAPDENYAREIMQLFTIGLNELNLDGTPKLNAAGETIDTYSNDDVVNLARVFTGLSFNLDSDTERPARRNFFNPADFYYTRRVAHIPMRIFEDYHDKREKSFLDTFIPENTNGDDSIRMALDGIFAHDNVAPFLSRQLIQRFTSSSPEPDYVARVATAFNNGRYVSANGTEFGTSNRGDLEATLAAILLDESLFDSNLRAGHHGKLKEPLLRLTQWFHAFDVENFELMDHTEGLDHNLSGAIGMAYFDSPSVFNFYRPGFVPPMTQAGELGLTVPESQLSNAPNISGFISLISSLVLEQPEIDECFAFDSSFGIGTWIGPSLCESALPGDQPFKPNYETEDALADRPELLVEHLNTKLTGGMLSEETEATIIETVGLIPLSSNNRAQSLRERTWVAVFMTIMAPAYSVAH